MGGLYGLQPLEYFYTVFTTPEIGGQTTRALISRPEPEGERDRCRRRRRRGC